MHNSLPFTKECLKTLRDMLQKNDHPGFIFDLVVVDDGSSDGTAEYISKNHPEVHLLNGDGNLWWSGAIEKGIRYAMDRLDTAYFLWWNNDIYTASDYFDAIIRLLKTDDHSKIYGSKILCAEDSNTLWSFGGFFHPRWGHSYMYGQGEIDGPEFSKPLVADWLPGMGTLLPAEVVRQVGAINTNDFPQYHGDVDFTRRAFLAGFKLEVRPELRIWNHTRHSGSFSNKKNKLVTLKEISSLNNFRKDWILYRKYATTPLAFVMLFKKYLGLLLKRCTWNRSRVGVHDKRLVSH